MKDQTEQAAQALQAVPFFTHLSKEEIMELAVLLVLRRFNQGQIIFHHGDPGGLLYIISQGKVKISYSTKDGQEALLAILGAGDFFGELALLDDSPRSATAEALETTDTLTLHREDFRRYLSSNPDFAMHVLQTMAKHIRRLNSQLSDIFFLDLSGRLARTLLRLADEHGKEANGCTTIDLSLTQTDLAEMTGATRVSINKTLGRFRRSGWVKLEGRRFSICNRAALEELILLSGGNIYA
ncbi:MAG: Crp/Fnr family transcriptional regulator [Candidatus Promineifilaceae bacterium]|jgi:CRP/FNR family transcriptional regulator/CRP/FNR family cyclic AMP-dependent transcriptional regulator